MGIRNVEYYIHLATIGIKNTVKQQQNTDNYYKFYCHIWTNELFVRVNAVYEKGKKENKKNKMCHILEKKKLHKNKTSKYGPFSSKNKQ